MKLLRSRGRAEIARHNFMELSSEKNRMLLVRCGGR
jgi:hypothetical protein